VVSTSRIKNVEPERLYDGLVEVWEAESGTLVASRQLPRPVSGISSTGLLYAIIEEPSEGHLSMVVWRLRLERGFFEGAKRADESATPDR
jgi:hypothetical protein